MSDLERAAPASPPPTAVSFRKYRDGDIPHCARLARDAWPAGPAMASKEIEAAGMVGYMQYSLDSSNWAEIAISGEEVVGFLFGRIDGCGEAPEKSHLGELPSLLRSIIRHDRKSPRLLRFAWGVAMTDLKLRLNTPPSDASVEMFIVDSRHKGKGIGSALLERFLSAARDTGSTRVTVYTDDLMSDWRFYERRGFKKVTTFYDNITSYYSGTRSLGIVYAMDLERTEMI